MDKRVDSGLAKRIGKQHYAVHGYLGAHNAQANHDHVVVLFRGVKWWCTD
jgi:hypothetical protein